MCLLIAITPDMTVVATQWCDREKQAAWQALMARIPAPDVVVCDGHKGLLAAIKTCWPDTLVQRCLVHIRRDVVTYLTQHPRTEAGTALLGLTTRLTHIATIDQAGVWMAQMNDWWTVFGHLTTERSYLGVTPAEDVPSWVRPGQRWWYTHASLRSAWRLLNTQIKAGTLFCYLDHPGVDATTNKIEGGINAQIRLILSRHRGMSPAHQRRAADWFCYLHSCHPSPHALLTQFDQHHHHAQPVDDPVLPPLYGTGLTAEEGLWTRKGWAGRST
jgi:hypothetical protein